MSEGPVASFHQSMGSEDSKPSVDKSLLSFEEKLEMFQKEPQDEMKQKKKKKKAVNIEDMYKFDLQEVEKKQLEKKESAQKKKEKQKSEASTKKKLVKGIDMLKKIAAEGQEAEIREAEKQEAEIKEAEKSAEGAESEEGVARSTIKVAETKQEEPKIDADVRARMPSPNRKRAKQNEAESPKQVQAPQTESESPKRVRFAELPESVPDYEPQIVSKASQDSPSETLSLRASAPEFVPPEVPTVSHVQELDIASEASKLRVSAPEFVPPQSEPKVITEASLVTEPAVEELSKAAPPSTTLRVSAPEFVPVGLKDLIESISKPSQVNVPAVEEIPKAAPSSTHHTTASCWEHAVLPPVWTNSEKAEEEIVEPSTWSVPLDASSILEKLQVKLIVDIAEKEFDKSLEETPKEAPRTEKEIDKSLEETPKEAPRTEKDVGFVWKKTAERETEASKNDQKMRKKMDDVLMNCFLQAVKTRVKNHELPMMGTTLYGKHMRAIGRSRGVSCDVKDSSYLWLRPFLESLENEGLLKLKPEHKDPKVVWINRNHPAVLSGRIADVSSPITEATEETKRQQQEEDISIFLSSCTSTEETSQQKYDLQQEDIKTPALPTSMIEDPASVPSAQAEPVAQPASMIEDPTSAQAEPVALPTSMTEDPTSVPSAEAEPVALPASMVEDPASVPSAEAEPNFVEKVASFLAASLSNFLTGGDVSSPRKAETPRLTPTEDSEETTEKDLAEQKLIADIAEQSQKFLEETPKEAPRTEKDADFVWKKTTEREAEASNNDQKMRKKMDAILLDCFLQAVKTRVKNHELPMMGTTLYGKHMRAISRNRGISCDVKDSSYLWLRPFLDSLEDDGLLKLKPEQKDPMVIWINRNHPALRQMQPKKTR